MLLAGIKRRLMKVKVLGLATRWLVYILPITFMESLYFEIL